MGTPIPANQAAFTLDEIVATTGAVTKATQGTVVGVTTDSRAEVRGKLFVALKGDNFDGHAYVSRALQQGAAAVLVEEDVAAGEGIPVLRVASTLNALGLLARLHRHRWGGRVVAIGGSAGKTTTRCATTALLSALLPGAVHTSVGNLNNRIGVPMVLLGLLPEHSVAVVEIGTNLRGEVAQLAAIAEPDIAVLTLVALEHSEGLGSLDEIEAEEGALLIQAKTAAIANGDDERALRQLRASGPKLQLSYGLSQHCDYQIVERQLISLERSRVSFTRMAQATPHSFDTSLLGMPGALAALAAVSVADLVQGQPTAGPLLQSVFSQQGIGEVGRLRPFELQDGTLLLDDTYNANPASVRAAIEVAREVARHRGSRLVLVLGEMRELGPVSPGEHAALGEAVIESGAAAVLAVAGDAKHLATVVGKSKVVSEFVAETGQALQVCRQLAQAGDVILFKGSRSVGLERVVAELIKERGLK